MLNDRTARAHVHDGPPVLGEKRIYADGEMADRICRFPWDASSVGAMSGWSETLLCTVNTMLESRFPMLLLWGPEMVVMYNDACIPLLWGRHPHALGQTARDCWSEAWHILESKLTAVLERGEKLYFENDLIPIFRNGILTDFYWTYSYSPVRDAAGVVRGILDVSHDVTATLTAERERDAMAARLKNVLESTTDGLALLDKQWRYTYVNDQGARIVSMRPEDLVGKSVWDLFPHASETAFVREARRAEETGQPRHFDAFYPEPLNVWLECHCYPSEHGLSVYFRDVTEQKRTEKALRASESRFRKLFESDLMGVAIPDRFGAFRESNDELLRMTGYTRADQEAGLVRWDTMTPPEYAELDAAHIREAARRGSCTPYEKEYIRKDGSRVPILCGYALLEESEDEYVGFVLDLSEQKLAERELREREERFRALAESLPQLIWMANSRGETTYCNQRVFEYFGLAASETGIPSWRERFHPEDVENTFGAWRKSIERSEPYQIEYRLRRHDGAYRHFLARAVPVRNEAGDVERWIGSCTDIHDQKLAERGLREREERFRILADSLPQLIWMTDDLGENTYCNQRYLDYLGVTEAERTDIQWLDLVHPEDLAPTLKVWNHSVETGEPYLNEFRLRRKDGMFRYFLARAVPYRNDLGQIERWIGSLTDIQDQKVAEDALREREQRFRVLAESLPQLVWIRDPDGQYIYCNQRLLDYVGRPVEWLQRQDWEAVHPDDVDTTLQKWKLSHETGVPYENEYRLRRHDGVYRWFLARGVPIRNESGQIERWLGSSTDVQDRKLAEDALRRTEKLTTAGRLAASMAHEINNPLAAVVNTLFLALQDPALSESARSLLESADRELARIGQYVTQTLRFHKQSSAPSDVDLGEIMDSALAMYAPRFRASSIRLERQYRTHEKLRCFSSEVRQVFANLIGNALDASAEEGRIQVRIRASRTWTEPAIRGIRVLVADTGAGIPRELRTQVFEPFVSTKEITGVGLGLWVSQGIVHKHNGRITLRTSTGPTRRGTLFSVFFPFPAAN